MQEIAETKARVLFIMTETFTVADPQLIVASHWSPTKKHAELYVTVSLHFGVITLQRIWVTASQHHCVTASLRHSVTSILWETLMVHRRSERVDFLLQVGVKTLNFWPAVHISAVKFFLFILIFIGGRSDSRPWQQLAPKNRIRLSFFGRNSSDLFWSDPSWADGVRSAAQGWSPICREGLKCDVIVATWRRIAATGLDYLTSALCLVSKPCCYSKFVQRWRDWCFIFHSSWK